MPTSSNDIKYLASLSCFQKFGPVRLKKLLNFFPNPEASFKATTNELMQSGIEENIALEFVSTRPQIIPEELEEKMARENIFIITPDNEKYPRLLTEIFTPPQIIYYKGNFETKDEFSLAVVGTRKFTSYGKQVTESIVKNLVQNNLTIVSGLAFGIDTLAHSATLEAKGRTIAVLGTGIDRTSIYPTSNRYLAEKIIAEGGAVISEFPLGTPPLKHHFPQRNRIISGLSLGTLVVEAGEKSGALITANQALEQNREVFAVPGNIFSPVSIGPNKLIKLGAKAVTSAEEIIEALNLTQIKTYINNKEIIPESPAEEKIITLLSHEPKHINEIVRESNLDTATTNSTLVVMEMKGMVRNLGGMMYIKNF
ncbi:MAG: DNA-processing protein DprA [Patescibacteria group bacterium]|nr:DNA-processing protein DprA [Patescibacteria group bacterium]MDD4610888.1 DNA-processing protein DprA [Patescibacteria group bacterium]